MNKIIELYPTEESWNKKGIFLYGLIRYEEAIECFDKAIEICPTDEVLWNNKFSCLSKLNRDTEEMMECLDKMIELNPSNVSSTVESNFCPTPISIDKTNVAKTFDLTWNVTSNLLTPLVMLLAKNVFPSNKASSNVSCV